MSELDDLYYNSDEPVIAQTADWTCSACSLAWLNRALKIDHATDEWSAVDYIGAPDNINSMYGLMDANGTRLSQCLHEQGAPNIMAWFDWSTLYELALYMPVLIGGVTWNHWVAVRYAMDSVLWLANSAIGWRGVGNTLDFAQFSALGPFACVAVPLHHSFPSPPTP